MHAQAMKEASALLLRISPNSLLTTVFFCEFLGAYHEVPHKIM